MKIEPAGLWRHADFMRLWVGQTISLLGSQIGGTAMGLAAILTLGATPMQLGILSAVGAAPVLVFGLLAGVWVDRLHRRPILIAADVGRAVLLATIPLAALLGLLRIELLYAVGALLAALTVFFDVAYRSYLPSLVSSEHLVEGNSKLSVSESLAEIVGPALGGALVQVITAPFAILFDALSFFASALAFRTIRAHEPATEIRAQAESSPAPEARGVMHEIAEGLRASVGQPVLRALLGVIAMDSVAGGMIGTLYGIYVINELGLTPLLMGVVIGVGGASALIGALLAERVVKRFGVGATLMGTGLIGWAASFLIVLAGGPLPVTVSMLVLSQATDVVGAIFAINSLSLRQAVAPNHLLGRVNASAQFLNGVLIPVGALLAGFLAERIGLRATMAIGIVIGGASLLWIVFSPIRRMRVIESPTLVA